MEYSKTPWRVECEKFEKNYHNPNAWPRLFSGDFEICGTEGFYSENLELDKANARRIVACVNACANITTDRLEMALPGQLKTSLDNLCAEIELLEAQRDALLMALEYCIKQVPEFSDVPGIASAIQQVRSKE